MLQVNQRMPVPEHSLFEAQGGADDIDWRWLINAVRPRLWLIVLLAIVGGAAAAAHVATRPASYTAFTQLQLTNLKLTFSRDDAFFAESQSEPTFLETQIQIMRSGKIALAVVDSLKLADAAASSAPDGGQSKTFAAWATDALGSLGVAETLARWRGALERPSGSDEAAEPAAEAHADSVDYARRLALKTLQRSYSVERVGLSNIVEIKVTAPDRAEAARVANELAQVYIADQQAARIEAAQSASVWLRERLKDVGPRTRIVAAAAPPMDKSDPRGVLVIAIGCVFGAGLGAAATLLLQFRDRTVRTPEQAEAAIGAECLGVVPRIRSRRLTEGVRAPDGERLTGDGGALLSEALNRPFGRLSRTVLNASSAIGEEPRSVGARAVGVTSTYSGEGASTIAANLARLLAASGRRTLLVDCNPHRPTLSRRLAPAASAGLSCLAQTNAPELKSLLYRDERSGMDFLPIGLAEKASALNLWSDAGPRLLKAADADYDFVVCDLPALCLIGDVRSSANHIDRFLIALRWGKVDRDHLRVAVRSAGLFREKISGIILNRARPGGVRASASPAAAFFSRKLAAPRRPA